MATKFKVGVTRDFGPGGELEGLLDSALAELLDPVPNITFEFLDEYKPVVSADQVEGFDVVITGEPVWTAESFRGLSRLSGVAFWGAGFNDIDVKAATEADVIVSITTPAVRRPVAESAVGFMLALSKNMVVKDRLTRDGRLGPDERMKHTGILIHDRVIGCVGFGNVGQEFVRLAKAFEPSRVLVTDPHVSRERAAAAGVEVVDLASLLRESDFVVVMCPLTEQTRGMLGRDQFHSMKRSAFLINVGRGKIVKQAELEEALREGWIKGAALDVFEKEPPDSADPILKLDNVIVTAHCITWTEEMYRDNGVQDCLAALSVFHGTPPAYVANREVLERPRLQEKLAAYAAAALSAPATRRRE